MAGIRSWARAAGRLRSSLVTPALCLPAFSHNLAPSVISEAALFRVRSTEHSASAKANITLRGTGSALRIEAGEEVDDFDVNDRCVNAVQQVLRTRICLYRPTSPVQHLPDLLSPCPC